MPTRSCAKTSLVYSVGIRYPNTAIIAYKEGQELWTSALAALMVLRGLSVCRCLVPDKELWMENNLLLLDSLATLNTEPPFTE